MQVQQFLGRLVQLTQKILEYNRADT
jgi:hypothetical protein